MRVLPCNQTTFFDVDDTLAMWHRVDASHPDAVAVTCPTSRHLATIQEVNPEGWEAEEPVSIGEWTEYLLPHTVHIEQLKLHKLRGHTIIVWSAGGWDWALAVVKALKLEQYVDLIISKPTWCYDDKKPDQYMPPSQFMKEKP